MWRTIDEKLIQFSIRHLEHIPPGTQVDPAEFPENEYPVRCLRCRYTLRGLPDGRCPECGEESQRGLLLVEEYARGRRPKGDRQARIAWRLITVFGFVSIGLPAALLLLFSILLRWEWMEISLANFNLWSSLIVGAMRFFMAGIVAFPLAVLVVLISLRPPRKKSRPVCDAARKRARATLAGSGPKTPSSEA